MPRRAPTIEEILTAFEAEAATAVRFASVDRDLLQRLIDDHRRLEKHDREVTAIAAESAATLNNLGFEYVEGSGWWKDVAAQRLGEGG